MHFSFGEAVDHPQKVVWINCLDWSNDICRAVGEEPVSYCIGRDNQWIATITNCNFHPTTTSSVLTPILPYPATSYDAMWADEGVHRITKEIQLVKPDQFLIFTSTTSRKLNTDGRDILDQMSQTSHRSGDVWWPMSHCIQWQCSQVGLGKNF